MYWWVTTISAGGKFCIFGPYASEEQANEYGLAHFGTNYEIEQLATKDTAKATRILKKMRFEAIHDLDTALQRAKHKLPEER